MSNGRFSVIVWRQWRSSEGFRKRRIRGFVIGILLRNNVTEKRRSSGSTGSWDGITGSFNQCQVVLRVDVLHQIYVACMVVESFLAAVRVSWVVQGHVIRVSDPWNSGYHQLTLNLVLMVAVVGLLQRCRCRRIRIVG